jgi:hypothetical protein
MLGIIVQTKFEGIHNYPDAPKEVAFLRTPHRHEFHVNLQMETFHDDREIEFIMVKRALDAKLQFLYGCIDIGKTSCEQIATVIQAWAKATYPVPENIIDTYPEIVNLTRRVNVIVMEDDENGAFVKEF